MGYHPLAEQTGGDDERRNQEAHRIIFELGLYRRVGDMREKERQFVIQSKDRLQEYGTRATFSAKQIFWLRDIKETYL